MDVGERSWQPTMPVKQAAHLLTSFRDGVISFEGGGCRGRAVAVFLMQHFPLVTFSDSLSLPCVQIDAHGLNLGQGTRQRKGLEADIEMLYFTRLPSGRTGRGSHLNYMQVIRQDR